MKLPKLTGALRRAIERSRANDVLARTNRHFETSIDGVRCAARCRLEIAVDFEHGRSDVYGDAYVQILTVEGERVECLPGHIRFTARQTAIVDPAPLFMLAAAEAASFARGTPVFRACAERLALDLSTPVSTPRPSRRL